jgi:predicted transcriptional regulator
MIVEKIKVTYRLPEDLVKRIRHLAVDEDTNSTAIIITALKEYLDKRQPPK